MTALVAPFTLSPAEAALVAAIITGNQKRVSGRVSFRCVGDAETAMDLFERLMDDLEQATN